MNSIIAFKEVIEHNEENEDQDKYKRKDIGKCFFVLIIIIKFFTIINNNNFSFEEHSYVFITYCTMLQLSLWYEYSTSFTKS